MHVCVCPEDMDLYAFFVLYFFYPLVFCNENLSVIFVRKYLP
jgi:hypothetical protein